MKGANPATSRKDWTSSEFSSFHAPYRYVDHDMPVFGINYDSHKRTWRSVRCVKNL